MKLVFIDEVEQSQKNKNFFGIGSIEIDSKNYSIFKKEFQKEFKILNWERDKEFKGRYLFSQKGDKNINIDKRVDFVDAISKLTSSTTKKTSRVEFNFAYNFEGKTKENYKTLLSKLIGSIPVPRDQRGDKNVIIFFIDNFCEMKKKEIETIVLDSLKKVNNRCKAKKAGKPKKEWILFERPFILDSDNSLCGILTVDILCYLKSWIELDDTKEMVGQMSLFNSKQEIKIKKTKQINEIISNVKKIKIIK